MHKHVPALPTRCRIGSCSKTNHLNQKPHLKCALIMWMGCAKVLGQWYRPCGPPLPRGSTPISTMWVSGSRSFSVCSVWSTLQASGAQGEERRSGAAWECRGRGAGWVAGQPASDSSTAHCYRQMGGVALLNTLANTLPITLPACPPERHPRHRPDQQLLCFPQVGGIRRRRAQVCKQGDTRVVATS